MTNTATFNASNKITNNCGKLKYILRTKQKLLLSTFWQHSKSAKKISSEFSGEKDRDRQTEAQRGEGRNKIPSLFIYYF